MTERTLAARAVWLVVLAAGFWVLALGLWSGFVILGWWIATYATDSIFAAYASWLLALALTIGLFPGRLLRGLFDRDSSPRARPHDEHARLRAFVEDVAKRAGGRHPDSLTLLHEANAFASVRRVRWFGKTESIIGIGLPLFALLTEDELRSVLAHEMGHHLAADVKLGPWVYRMRKIVAHAADQLEGSSFWLHLPFVAYARLFMRSSLWISRAQELSADARAARVAGAAATASALRKIEVMGEAWQAYFQTEVVPVVSEDRLPPLLDGFDAYWKAAQTPGTPAFHLLTRALEANRRPSTDDTHPTLDERLRALGDPASESAHIRASLGLLDAVPDVEERVVRALLRDSGMPLARVGWESVAVQVWLPRWRKVAHEASPLRKLRFDDLANAVNDWAPIAKGTRVGLALSSPEAERRRVVRLLSAWFTVGLADARFEISALPGEAVRAERDGKALHPFKVVEDLADGTMNAAGWARVCEEHGF